ncbi:MAG TPA: VIT1/CCC1 transporter family protein [Actinomycetota bacterium]|jgi:VIT1/CCC1 family predicted Fe2+/Mn2+ transporter|nr:VIT1/CCC1 transporter family protein [Actinomycetota bacterium]
MGREGSRTHEMLPHPGPTPAEGEVESIIGGRSGALRAAIFGANDGLVSNLSLIMGVAGAGVDPHVIVLAGVAGLLAGAFSMGAGEYVSMRVQRELFERLIHIEAHELAEDPEGETRELAGLLERRGIPRPLAGETATALMADPKIALDVHVKEELGLDPQELGSPWGAASSSFVAFSIGAFIPLVAFLFGSGVAATLTAVPLSLIALFTLGAFMARYTGRTARYSGIRMLLIGGGAALVTYGVGRILGVAVS